MNHTPYSSGRTTTLQEALLSIVLVPAAIADKTGQIIAVNDAAREQGWETGGRAPKNLAELTVPIEGGVMLVSSESELELKMMRDVVLHSSEGVLICRHVPGGTPAFPIVFANESMSQISGYNVPELLGQSPAILQGKAPLDGFRQRIRQAIANGTAVTVEGINFRKNQEAYNCRCTIFPLRQRGVITHWVGLHSDITEHRRAEEQFQHSQRLEGLGILAGGVAHDFNNILTCVLGYTMMAQMEMPSSSPVQEHLRQVIASCSRAQELVRALLAYSAKCETKMQNLQLGEFAEETMTLMKGALSKKARIRSTIEAAGTVVEADSSQLRQVLMNLLINAGDAVANAKDAEIALSVKRLVLTAPVEGCRIAGTVPAGDWIHVSVQDNGCGMNEDVLRNIFTPLYTTKPNGHGLGLSAVLGIMKRHGGHLICRSEVSKGTRFELYFRPSPVAPPPQKTSLSFEPGGHVLIVDDEPTALAAEAEILTRLGFKPLTAPDGKQGLEVFQKHKDTLRIAFIDFSMPVMAGLELLRALREESEIPVVITTGFRADSIKPHLTALPAHVQKNVHCIEKPTGSDTIRSALATMLVKGA